MVYRSDLVGGAAHMIVGRIGKVGQIKFSCSFENPGITSGGVIYPVISGCSLQPFLWVRPVGCLADQANQFIIEIEVEGCLFRLYLMIDPVPGWKTDLLIGSPAAFEQVYAAPVELVIAGGEIIQIFMFSISYNT